MRPVFFRLVWLARLCRRIRCLTGPGPDAFDMSESLKRDIGLHDTDVTRHRGDFEPLRINRGVPEEWLRHRDGSDLPRF
jgi:hypothetical protein